MINKKAIAIIFLMFVSATLFAQKTYKPEAITFPDSIAPVGIIKGLSDSALLKVVQKQTNIFLL